MLLGHLTGEQSLGEEWPVQDVHGPWPNAVLPRILLIETPSHLRGFFEAISAFL